MRKFLSNDHFFIIFYGKVSISVLSLVDRGLTQRSRRAEDYETKEVVISKGDTVHLSGNQ